MLNPCIKQFNQTTTFSRVRIANHREHAAEVEHYPDRTNTKPRLFGFNRTDERVPSGDEGSLVFPESGVLPCSMSVFMIMVMVAFHGGCRHCFLVPIFTVFRANR